MAVEGQAVPRERPEWQCDIVMKGGITSGVVYPFAVCELASTYRLRNVGGTSAGAIAAAAAAAAEYGRGSGGYDHLAALPEWIGSDGNLAKLFQPQKSTRRLYALLLAAISHRHLRPVWIALAACRSWVTAAVGALPGVALVVLAVRDGSGALQIAASIAGGMLAIIGTGLALTLRLKRIATKEIPANAFGLCSGMPGHRSKHQALTQWLAELIDRAAGRPWGPDAPPLTFGHLWAGPDGDVATADPNAPWMRLEMMTTNVTNHRAERLPGGGQEYFFSPTEFRALFPERIVRWMLEHSPPLEKQPARRRQQELLRKQLLPLVPLPHPADMPVIVATRMSLSFPVLLSAVPLWRIDFSREGNQQARQASRTWLTENAAVWDALVSDPKQAEHVAKERPRVKAERCWFSDGGISSNFPVQFFDTLLPGHPTVGLNLRPFHPDRSPSANQDDNVWLPERHNSGILDWWYRFDGNLGGFLGNVVRTMQNRIDDAQMRVPGYRDRVVHVSLTEREGGMNLTMAPEVINALTARGRAAGRRLVERFATPPAATGDLGWHEHRWVRLRVLLPATANVLESFVRDYDASPTAGGSPYAALAHGSLPDKPTSYPISTAQRDKAKRLIEDINGLVAALGGMQSSLADGSPNPRQGFRLTPEDPTPQPKPTSA
jgi:Patatin-like phospholipase